MCRPAVLHLRTVTLAVMLQSGPEDNMCHVRSEVAAGRWSVFFNQGSSLKQCLSARTAGYFKRFRRQVPEAVEASPQPMSWEFPRGTLLGFHIKSPSFGNSQINKEPTSSYCAKPNPTAEESASQESLFQPLHLPCAERGPRLLFTEIDAAESGVITFQMFQEQRVQGLGRV